MKTSQIVAHHWPAVAAVVLLLAAGFWPIPGSVEVARAVASVACILLLAYDWTHHKTRTKGWPGLLFSLVLLVPGLGALWLGLNVVRYYSYAPETPGNLYDVAVRAQDVVRWSCVVVLLAIFGLVILSVTSRLLGRLR